MTVMAMPDKAGMLPPSFTAFAAAKPEPQAVTAAREGNKDMLMQSWRQKASEACEADQFGQTALHIVAETNNENLAKELTWHYGGKKLNFNLQDHHGRTAMYVAAAAESLSVVKLLIREGVDINLPDNRGVTPLMAACKSGSTESVKELVKHENAKLNISDQFGVTALMYACDGGWTDIAQALIGKGADVNQSDQHGRTALHLACKRGDVEIIKQIRDAGGDLQARDIKGLGAIHLCGSETAKEFLVAELRKFAMYRQQYIIPLAKLPLEGRHGLVLTGVDLERGCPVVLKFYRRKSHRNRALDSVLKLDQDYVASVPADTVGELARYVFKDKEGYPKFPYCLVLFAGEQTLQTILSNPRGLRPVMPQQQLLHIFRSLAECVEHIHMQGVVHCNIKPKNVMEFPDGHFRLVNMENASVAGASQESHTTTLEICPPEIAKSWLREAPVMVQPSRDVWALGCVLYEMVFGTKLVADLVEEAERQVAEGGAAPPQVPPTELLGVLQMLSLLTQEQISSLVSAKRILMQRTRHMETPADAGDFLKQAKQEIEDKARNPGLRAKAQQVKAPPQKVDIKRSQRKQVVKAKEVADSSNERDLWEETLLCLSDLLNRMLRIDERERMGISDVMQSPALVMLEGAEETDIVGNIKTLKRKALRNQQQLLGKMDEVTSQLEQLYNTVSERGGSRDDRTSLTSGSYAQPTQRTGATKIQGERMASPPPVPEQTASVPALPQEISLTEIGPEPSSSSFAKSAKKKMGKMLKKSSSKAS